jgi:hypothetical protein
MTGLLYRCGAALTIALACFLAGMGYQAHRSSVAELEASVINERAARVLEAQQTRNMARINDELTQSRLASDRNAVGLERRLLELAEASPNPAPGCPSRDDETRPAAAVISDGARADLVELAKEADAVADRLRACQAALVGESGR